MHGAAAPRGRPGTGSAAAPATSRTVQSPSFSELGNMRRGRPQGVGAGVVRDGHHGDVGALAAGHAGRTDGPHSHAAPPRHDVRAGTLHQPPQVDPPPTPSPPPCPPASTAECAAPSAPGSLACAKVPPPNPHKELLLHWRHGGRPCHPRTCDICPGWVASRRGGRPSNVKRPVAATVSDGRALVGWLGEGAVGGPRSVILRDSAEAGQPPGLQWAEDSHWASVSWCLVGEAGSMVPLSPTLHVSRADSDGEVLVRSLPFAASSTSVSCSRSARTHHESSPVVITGRHSRRVLTGDGPFAP